MRPAAGWLIIAASLVAASAQGADLEPAADPEAPAAGRPAFALQVTPYLWAAGIEGHVSPFERGPTIPIEKPFSEIWDDLNFGGFVNVWGRYESFVFSADVMYVDTTDAKSFGPLPPPLPPIPSAEAEVDTQQFTATLQGGYRVIDAPSFTLDALGGVRFWHIANDVSVEAGPISLQYDEDFGWADPVIGARAFLRITDKLSLQAQADYGGFDVGAEETWQVLATANYVLSDHFSISGGYKVLNVNYDDDGHVFDTTLSGPVLGVTWRY